MMGTIPSDLCCSFAFVIASAVIVLSCWRKEERRKKKSEDRRFAYFGDLPVWYFSDGFQQS